MARNGWKVVLANHVSPNSVFAAFILLPIRFWPRIDRELPFLAIALNKTGSERYALFCLRINHN